MKGFGDGERKKEEEKRATGKARIERESLSKVKGSTNPSSGISEGLTPQTPALPAAPGWFEGLVSLDGRGGWVGSDWLVGLCFFLGYDGSS